MYIHIYTYILLGSARTPVSDSARQQLRKVSARQILTIYLSNAPPPRLGPPLSRSSSSRSSSSSSSSSTSSSIILILIAVVLVRISSGSSISRLLAVRVAVLISSPSDTPPPSDTNYLSI